MNRSKHWTKLVIQYKVGAWLRNMAKKEMTICDSCTYWAAGMQKYIAERQDDDDKQWIYDLIANKEMRNETIFVDTDELLLCKDIHPGLDDRYLLIFRDKSLKTIRNLEGRHVGLLLRAQNVVRSFLQSMRENNKNWYIFFHYTPSVFQLHAHVSTLRHNLDNSRKHPLACVIRNLQKDGNYYKTAMIMTPLCRGLKNLNLYTSIKA